MQDTMLHLDSGISPEPEFTQKAIELLESFRGQNMTVGEIDWLLSKARSLLAFSTFRDTSYPEGLQILKKSA